MMRLAFLVGSLFISLMVSAKDDVFEKPRGCLSGSKPCAVYIPKAVSSKKIKFMDHVVTLASGTVALFNGAERVRLIRGTLWNHQGSLFVETEFGAVDGADGEFWVIHQKHRVLVRNLSSQMNVHYKSINQTVGLSDVIPNGFESWFGAMTLRGDAQHGFVRPIDSKQYLKDLATCFQGDRVEFMKEYSGFKTLWKRSIASAGEMYQRAIDEKIENKKEEIRRQREVQERIQHEKYLERQRLLDHVNSY